MVKFGLWFYDFITRKKRQTSRHFFMSKTKSLKEIPGLMEGKAIADHTKCVDIATSAAIRRMIVPGLLAIGIPVIAAWFLVMVTTTHSTQSVIQIAWFAGSTATALTSTWPESGFQSIERRYWSVSASYTATWMFVPRPSIKCSIPA